MTLDSAKDEFLWVEKYRPKNVDDIILPEKTKTIFKKFVADKNVPNLLLVGGPGMGKTTAAKAMLNELGCDFIVKNGSMNLGIDVLRNEISNFASSVSFHGGRKYVIIDEADNLNPSSVQPALRNFIEEYSKNCGFILTLNYKNKLIKPVRESRLSQIDFSIEKSERPQLAGKFFKRVCQILDAEEVEYDKATIAKVIEKYFPDFRRVLTELQTYAASGRIDEGIFTNFKLESVNELFDLLKNKKFTEMRKWVADNSDQDMDDLFRSIYDQATNRIELRSMPGFVVELADYQYKAAFVADLEVNMVAFLTSIMLECSFK